MCDAECWLPTYIIMLSIHYTRIKLVIRNVHLNSFFVSHVFTSKNLQHGVRIVKSIKLWNLSNSNVNIFNHFHLIDSLTKVFYSYFNTCGTFYIGVVFRIHLSNYDSHTNMEKSFNVKMNPNSKGLFQYLRYNHLITELPIWRDSCWYVWLLHFLIARP